MYRKLVWLLFVLGGLVVMPSAYAYTQIVAGGYHSCGLKNDGTAVCWGDNRWGQTTVPAGSYRQISAGDFHTCGLKSDGSAVCWGYSDDGRTTVPAGSYSQIAAGGYHTCGLKNDGSIVCWGAGKTNTGTLPEYGQSAVLVGSYSQISAGDAYTCGLKNDGTAVCWGWNEYGQSTVPPGSYRQLTTGGVHTCGLKNDGSVVCWGWNEYGQTTVPTEVSTCSYTFSSILRDNYSSEGDEGFVIVTPSAESCAWTASSNQSWVSIISGSSHTGEGVVRYAVQANTTNSQRTGTLTIAGQIFRLETQDGIASCNYTLSPTSRTHTANAETGSVSITVSSNDCTWNASSNSDWASIISDSSGMGNGTVNYSVTANSGNSERSAILTIAGQTFTLNQSVPSSNSEFCTSGSANVNNLNCINGNCSGIKISCNSKSCQWCDGSNNCGNILYDGTTSIPNGSITCNKGRCNYKTQIGGSSSSGSFSCKIQSSVSCSYNLSPTSRIHTANRPLAKVI